MKRYFSSFPGFLFSAAFVVFSFVVDLATEAFAYMGIGNHRTDTADTADTEHVDRMSQTGNGVWAFVTNLFKVEGRTYTWQAGTIA